MTLTERFVEVTTQMPELRPPRRTSGLPVLVAALVVAVLAGVVALISGGGDDGEGRPSGHVETGADPAVSTSVAPIIPEMTTTVPAPSPSVRTPDPVTTTPKTTPTTAAPRPAAPPDRSRPAGATYNPHAIWPETLAELDKLQAAVDQGHQPWRNDPAAVARAYLQDRGVSDPSMGSFQATSADAGRVTYTVAGMAGRVDVKRLLKGSIWFVAGTRSDTHPGVQVDRQGGSLAVVVQGGADGTLTARAKRPGGAWGAERTAQAFAGGTRSLTVAPAEASADTILQLRHSGGGTVGVTEIFLYEGSDGVRFSALDSESRLTVDGLGPVRIGMGLEEAVATTGLAMKYREGPYCVSYTTDGPPAGLFLTSAEGSFKVDFITVSEPSIATLSGIRVGSTVAEVRKVYGERLRGSVQDGWGKLVYRADDQSLSHLSMAFLFSEGKVAGIWAGLRGVVEADEACA